MIVEGYRSPHDVVNDDLLHYVDKLRILEKWNQMLSIKIQVFPDQSDYFNKAQLEAVELINQLVKNHMHLHDPELMLD